MPSIVKHITVSKEELIQMIERKHLIKIDKTSVRFRSSGLTAEIK